MALRRRRILAWVFLAVAALLVAAAAVFHLPPVQQRLWRVLAPRLASALGMDITLTRVHLRLWPAHLDAEGVKVALPGRPPAVTAGSLQAAWSWLALLRSPHHIAWISVTGLTVDTAQLALPHPPPSPSPSRSAWPPVEVGRLVVSGGGATIPIDGVRVAATGLRVTGTSAARQASLTLVAASTELQRSDRVLPLGSLTANLAASPSGAVLREAVLDGTALHLQVHGEMNPLLHDQSLSAVFSAQVDLARIVSWWDPALQQRYATRGEVDVQGTAHLPAQGPPTIDATGHGVGVELAGYPVACLVVDSPGGQLRITTDSAWGEVTLGPLVPGHVPIAATLDSVALDPVRALLPPPLRTRVPEGASATGTLHGEVSLPVRLDALRAAADLRVHWPQGRASLDGSMEGGSIEIHRLDLAAEGASLSVSGHVEIGKSLDVRGGFDAAEPSSLAARLAAWLPALARLRPAGGALHAEVEAKGGWEDPRVDARVAWEHPEAAGFALDHAAVEAHGTLGALHADATIEAAGGTVELHGNGDLLQRRARAEWKADGLDLTRAGSLMPHRPPPPLGGTASGRGTLTLAGTEWSVATTLHVAQPSWGTLQADAADAELDASPASVEVHNVSVERGPAQLEIAGSLAPLAPGGRLEATLGLHGLTLQDLMPNRNEHLAGLFGADLTFGGTLSRPTLDGLLCYTPEKEAAPLGPLSVRLSLEGGVLTAESEALPTAAGSATVHAALPLGDAPRPGWLWPEAPSGPARLELRAPPVQLGPLFPAFGLEAPVVGIRTGIELTADWDPSHPKAGNVRLALPGLGLEAPKETVRAEGVPLLRVEGTRLVADRIHLVGKQTEIQGSGWVDISTRDVAVTADATVAPTFFRLFTPDVEVRRPVSAHLEVRGPLANLSGSASIEHPGGQIIMRDPPVQISDLSVKASIHDGIVDIDDGSATVNRGKVELAGGWNPAEQQGIVAQITGLTFLLPMGIFSQWNGLIAVEPRRGHRLALVGELDLQRGLWDQNLDLTSLLLQRAGAAAPPPVSSPLERVEVNLTVVGQGAIDVDNNVGSFQLRWQRLFVHGTLARPAIEGQIRILPNGQFSLGGQQSQIAQGTIDFSGQYGAEPQVEIVTESAVAGPTGQGTAATATSTQSVGLSELAQAGMLRSVGGLVGLTNSRLQPIDIATETEANPATTLTVAQAFGPHVVFFLTTDLVDTSQRTGLLQFWNWSSLPGVALQGFSSTTEGDGAAILDRRSFGGAPPPFANTPRLAGISLKGQWPGDTGDLRKEIGLDKGQLYDPFMVFLGEVRLERALAERGYPDARVSGSQVGSSQEPRIEYTVEPGPKADLRFTGDQLPLAVRHRVTAEYHFPPLEEDALENMEDSLHRELATLGYPFASVTVSRPDGAVEFHIEKGKNLELQHLRLEGVPPQVAETVNGFMDSPVHLAALANANVDEVTRLERVLWGEGYPDARLVSAEIVPTGGDDADVRAVVEPGRRVTVEHVELEGKDPLRVLQRPDFPLHPGVPFRHETLDAAAQQIRRVYQDTGYPDVSVRTAIQRREGYRWDVRLTMDPGTRRRVSDIEITGLHYLHENVVKAGVTLKKGDLVSLSAIDQTAANLATFAPIQRVEVRREDHAETSTIKVDVTEKPRWTVGAGVRYRSGTHEEYLLDLRDDDLLGRGLGVNLRGHWGRLSRAGRFLISLPPLPGDHLAFDGWISASHLQTGDQVERDQVATAEGRLYYGLGTQYRAYIQRSRTHVFAAVPNPDVEESFVTLGTVGGQVVVDRRNDPFNPTSGWLGSLDVSYSPKWLKSDSQVLRAAGALSYATTLGSDTIWAQGIRLGAAKPYGASLPETHLVRFFAGGETTVRGFDQDSIGPKEQVGDTLQPVGGGAQLILNQELRYHIFSRFFLAAFADAGQVWPRWSDATFDLSVGAGAGVRVLTPIGPVRVDVAWPVRRKEGNHGVKFYVGIGQVF